MYIAENESQPDKFSSIPETMWEFNNINNSRIWGRIANYTIWKDNWCFYCYYGRMYSCTFDRYSCSAFANQRAQRTAILEAEINQALSDGVISDLEAKKIEKLRKELNLSPEHSRSLMKVLSEKK